MKQLEPPNICYDRVFVMLQDGKTYRAVGEKYGYSYNGAWQMMKRETEKYL